MPPTVTSDPNRPARWILPAATMAALFVLYSPQFFKGVTFYSADSFAFYFTSLKYWFGELSKYETVALWNPYNNLGTSFLYNTTNAFFYPVHAFGFFFGSLTFYRLLWTGHLVLLAIGVMRWAKRANASWQNQLLVVVLFMASPFVSLFGVAGYNYLYAMTWSVWILGELDVDDPSSISLVKLLPCWSLLITCGEPITMMFVGAFVTFQLLKRRGKQSFAVFLLVSAATGLFVYGHGILALPHSTRAAGLTRDWILAFSFHPARLLTYFAPYFFGHPVRETFFPNAFVNSAPAVPRFLFDSPYLPSALFILVVIGVVTAWREKKSTSWLVALFAALVLSFGNFGPMTFLCYLPPFSMFRYPEKWILVANLFALHFAFRRQDTFLAAFREPWVRVLLLAGIVLPCLSFDMEYPIALASAGVLIFILRYERGKLTHQKAVFGLLLMGMVQAWFGLAPERTIPVKDLEGDTDVSRYIKSIIPEATLARFEVTPQAAQNDYPHRYMIYGTNMLSRRPMVFGYDSFMTPFQDNILQRLTGDATRFSKVPKTSLNPETVKALMQLTNLTALVVENNSPIRTLMASVAESAKVFKIRHQENGWSVLGPYTETSALWWFPELGQEEPDSDLIHWPPTVDKKRAFYRGVYWDWDKSPAGCSSGAGQTAQPWGEKAVRWTGKNEFLFSFNSPCEGWVFFSETALPGWRLYLNGEETPIFKANRTFVAFHTPTGKVEGRMTFVPFRTLYEGFLGRYLNPL